MQAFVYNPEKLVGAARTAAVKSFGAAGASSSRMAKQFPALSGYGIAQVRRDSNRLAGGARAAALCFALLCLRRVPCPTGDRPPCCVSADDLLTGPAAGRPPWTAPCADGLSCLPPGLSPVRGSRVEALRTSIRYTDMLLGMLLQTYFELAPCANRAPHTHPFASGLLFVVDGAQLGVPHAPPCAAVTCLDPWQWEHDALHCHAPRRWASAGHTLHNLTLYCTLPVLKFHCSDGAGGGLRDGGRLRVGHQQRDDRRVRHLPPGWAPRTRPGRRPWRRPVVRVRTMAAGTAPLFQHPPAWTNNCYWL